MKNGATYFKWSVILIGIIAAFYFFRGCIGGNGGTITKTDTISVVRDTFIYVTDTFISYIPKPYKQETIRDSIIYLERQPEFNDFPPIAKAWIEDYHTKKYYDTLVKDVDEYGGIMAFRVYDTVYKNRIVGRGVWKYMEATVLKETVTLREPPRTKGFIGLEIMGNLQTPISYTGASVGLLLKNQQYIGIKGGLLKQGNAIYGVEFKRLIKLKK